MLLFKPPGYDRRGASSVSFFTKVFTMSGFDLREPPSESGWRGLSLVVRPDPRSA